MTEQYVPTSAQEAAAEAHVRVVSELVSAQVAEAIETLFQQLDDALVSQGLVGEQDIAHALRPYGLADAWLTEWCVRPAPGPRTTEELPLLAAYRSHRAHRGADSLYGRCTLCGLSWGDQAQAAALLNGQERS